MRSFFGSILLILVLAALGATIYYHWSTNSHLEFELRHPDEPEKTTQVINMGTVSYTHLDVYKRQRHTLLRRHLGASGPFSAAPHVTLFQHHEYIRLAHCSRTHCRCGRSFRNVEHQPCGSHAAGRRPKEGSHAGIHLSLIHI